MALTKCIDCGQEVSTSAKTCPRCGAPIDSITPPQQQPQQLQQPPQQPQQVVQQQQVEPMPATKRVVEPKKKGSWGKFFLGLLLGFVLGALASYFLLVPPSDEDEIIYSTAQTDSVTHPVHNDKSSKEARSHNKSSHKASKESGKHKDEANNKDSKDSKEEEPNPEKSRKEIGTIMKDAKKKSDVKNLRDALNK